MTRQNPEPAPPRTVFATAFAALIALTAVAGVVIEIHGFRAGRLFDADIWDREGMRRLVHYIRLFLACAIPVMVLVPWSFTGLAIGLAGLGTVLAAGPVAPLAVALFLISAGALGSRLLGGSGDDSLPGQALATMVGTAVYIFLMTLVARLPVNYPLVWGALLALPIAWDRAGVRRRLAACAGCARQAELRSWGERAAAALLVFVLGMHWLVALKPEVGADALAMHMAIPAGIAAHHRMTFEPSRFIWSVMPMGADWIYSIVYQFGGEAGARLTDFAMLLSLVAMLYGAARKWLARSAALLVAALFASTPLVQLVTGSLFVENVLAALVLAMLMAIWRLGETGNRRNLFAAALLGGAAVTTKVGALPLVALAIPFAAAEAIRHWRTLSRRPVATCALAVLLLVATAVPSYAIAYGKTHNPVFPFLNHRFPCPFLDYKEDLVVGYHFPISWRTLYDMTFETAKRLEGSNGAFGFQYLVLAPLALAGLLALRDRREASAAAIALAAGFLTLRADSNVRYVYAALPVLTIAFAAVLGWTASRFRTLYGALIAASVVCAGLNVYFLPASGWWHRDFYSPYTFARHGAERYLVHAAPERLVIRHYNQIHSGSALLLAADTNIADVRGEVYENSWHQWDVAISIQHAIESPAMESLFEGWNVKYFIAPAPGSGATVQLPSLRQFLDSCTVPEYELGGWVLSRLSGKCPGLESHAWPPGTYDDANAAVRFTGHWDHDRLYNGAFGSTISFTDAPGALAKFAFTGQAVTYLFTRTFNRGIAEVRIDGTDSGAIDLYSPKTEWQSSRRFTVAPGRHEIQVRAAGRKSEASSGRFVDVDGFVVE